LYIEKIKLINFRNYEKLDIDGFSKGLNLVYGDNAQGKTNLIEAINMCANGKSFRSGSDSKTILYGSGGAYTFVEYESKGRKQSMEALIEKDRKKSFKKNGVPLKSLKEMLGNLFVVVFSPEDIKTAKESPSLRRAFLDGEISKIRPSYVDALKKYSEIINQKNAVLRKRETNDTQGVLRAYNVQLKEYIKIILKNRLAYVKKLNEYVGITHEMISGGVEEIDIKYSATIKNDDIGEQLEKLIPKEIYDSTCSSGPHRDDIDIRINGRDIKTYASQGQLRTLMLAVKIACLRILGDSTGHTPILLLDDVFSELDDSRKRNLIKGIRGIQTFITTADSVDVKRIKKAALINVKDGKAVLESSNR